MNPTLTIDSLHLRLPGIPPALAQEAVALLGPALEQAMARHPLPPGGAFRPTRLHLTPPPLRLIAPPTSAAALAQQLANHILEASVSSISSIT